MTASMTRWEFLVALAKVVGVIGTGAGGLAYYAAQLKTPEGADRMDKSEWENETHATEPPADLESRISSTTQNGEESPTLVKIASLPGSYLGHDRFGRATLLHRAVETATGYESRLVFYDNQFSVLDHIPLPSKKSMQVCISPDGKYLAMSGYDGPAHWGDEIEKGLRLNVFEIEKSRLRLLFEKDIPHIYGFGFSNNSQHLAIVRNAGVYDWSKDSSDFPDKDIVHVDVTILDTNTWSEVENYENPVYMSKNAILPPTHIRFSSDDSVIAIRAHDTFYIRRGRSGVPSASDIFTGWLNGCENIEIDGRWVIGTTQVGDFIGERSKAKFNPKPKTAYIVYVDFREGEIGAMLEQGKTGTSLVLYQHGRNLFVGNENEIRIYENFELRSSYPTGRNVGEIRSKGDLLFVNLAEGMAQTELFRIK